MTKQIPFMDILGDLKDPQRYNVAWGMVQRVIVAHDIVEATNVLEVLPQWIDDPAAGLNKTSQEYQELSDALWSVRWVAFNALLNDSERIGLFAEHVRSALVIPDFSLWDTTRLYLATLPVLEDRLDFKRNINNALLRNGEMLTSRSLVRSVMQDSEKRDPTIANWLRDYVSNTETRQSKNLVWQEYILHNINASKLTEQERSGLLNIIVLYEHAKLRSDTEVGLENNVNFTADDGTPGVFREGQAESASASELREVREGLAVARNILAQYGIIPKEISKEISVKIQRALMGPSTEREAVQKEEHILRATKTSLRDELFQAITNKQPERAHAALRLLAEQGSLLTLVSQDDRLSAIVKKEVNNRFSKSAQIGFQASRPNPVYIALLLQALYHDRLGLKTDKSARFGMQLIIMANKKQPNPELTTMVYVDVVTGTFKWSKIVEKNGNMIFEENV